MGQTDARRAPGPFWLVEDVPLAAVVVEVLGAVHQLLFRLEGEKRKTLRPHRLVLAAPCLLWAGMSLSVPNHLSCSWHLLRWAFNCWNLATTQVL